jgi:DNA-binding HxlR family transcriptional regulator
MRLNEEWWSMSSDSIIDAINFNVLAELTKVGPMRYVQLKNKLNVSDSSLTSRLNALKGQGLITIEAVDNKEGRNYIVYKLTKAGESLVAAINLPKILDQLNSYTLA